MKSMTLTLIVLYTQQMQVVCAFYEILGLEFTSEKHGTGPEHFSTNLKNGVVLEIYPGTPTNVRLGIEVESLSHTLRELRLTGLQVKETLQQRERQVAIVEDPDKRKIELSQA